MISRLMGKFFPGGERSKLVDLLFAQAGVPLPEDTSLEATNTFLQEYMKKERPDGAERWDLSDPDLHSPSSFIEIARELGLVDPVGLHEDVKELDLMVIPGSTYKAMHHRLRYGISCCANIGKITMLASHRPVNEEESRILGKFLNSNEGTAAQLALLNTTLPKSVISADVLIARDREEGGRARTEETIELLDFVIELRGGDVSMLFSLHQPYGWRQVLTIERIMRAKELITPEWQPHFVIAPPLVPLDKIPGRTFDEVCKLVYELSLSATAVA